MSPGIDVLRCGFLPFHDYVDFQSDHPLILVEICNYAIFGHFPQKIFKAPLSRVKSKDPRNREIYIERVLKQYEEEGVHTQFAALSELCTEQSLWADVGAAIELLHAELEGKTIRIRQGVDKNLLKFYTSTTPWSPELQQHRNQIEYWYRTLCTKTNVLTSHTIIKRLSIKLGEYSGQYLTAAEAIVQLKKAWKDCKAAKTTVHTMRPGFQESYIKQLAKDRNVSQASMKSMMERGKRLRNRDE